eukprot:9475272-Pyramimonas_sp.AAC.1
MRERAGGFMIARPSACPTGIFRACCSEPKRWRRTPGAGAARRARRTGWARGGPPPLPTAPAS